MRSLSGPHKNGPGLIIEVLLGQATVLQCGQTLGHRFSGISESESQPSKENNAKLSSRKVAQVRVEEVYQSVAQRESVMLA